MLSVYGLLVEMRCKTRIILNVFTVWHNFALFHCFTSKEDHMRHFFWPKVTLKVTTTTATGIPSEHHALVGYWPTRNVLRREALGIGISHCNHERARRNDYPSGLLWAWLMWMTSLCQIVGVNNVAPIRTLELTQQWITNGWLNQLCAVINVLLYICISA